METGAATPGRKLANRIEVLLGIPARSWEDPADLLPQDGSELDLFAGLGVPS